MALKVVHDTLDEIDEPFRTLYTEDPVTSKFRLTGVDGVKTPEDIARLSTALTKEKAEHKATKEKANRFSSVFGDKDPNEVLAQLDRLPELEAAAAGKLDEEKLNGIVETRIKGKLAPVARELEQAKAKLAEKDTLLAQYEAKDRNRAIHDQARAAAIKLKVIDTAHEDMLLLAERMLEIDESGNVVTKSDVGVTPGISAEVWLTEMQAKRPHWWPPSAGGGGRGSGGGGGFGENPWSAENWNMTRQGQILRENPTKADQMAKAAGTTVGGLKPAARK